MKLSEIKVGEPVNTGKLEHIVLEHREDGTTLLLLKDFWEKAEFDFGTANYVTSSMRKKLNTTFYKTLSDEVGAENIIEHTVDLTSDDGRKDYGVVNDKISLLTDTMYRRFIDILDRYNPDEWWWLATALSTKVWTSFVRVVCNDGAMGLSGCGNDYGGVRPFYIVKSDISVS